MTRSANCARLIAATLICSCVSMPSSSRAVTTSIVVNVPSGDIVYDRFSNKLYVSVPSSAGPSGNSIRSIDPSTGALGTPLYVGSEPHKLAIADDGSYLYADLNGAAAVRRVDLRSQVAGLQFAVGTGSFGLQYVEDMEVMPGSPQTVAISRMKPGYSPRHEGVAIYDDGLMRPTTTPGHTGSNVIEFSKSAGTLYGYNNETTEYGFRTMSVTAGGVSTTNTRQIISGFSLDIDFDGDRMYSTNGRVFDPATGTLLGTMAASGSVAADSSVGRTFFLSGNTIKAFDQQSFLPLGQITVPGVSGSSGDLTRFGSDGLAFRTDAGQVFLVRDAQLVPEPASLILLGMGVVAIALWARRRRCFVAPLARYRLD